MSFLCLCGFFSRRSGFRPHSKDMRVLCTVAKLKSVELNILTKQSDSSHVNYFSMFTYLKLNGFTFFPRLTHSHGKKEVQPLSMLRFYISGHNKNHLELTAGVLYFYHDCNKVGLFFL